MKWHGQRCHDVDLSLYMQTPTKGKLDEEHCSLPTPIMDKI